MPFLRFALPVVRPRLWDLTFAAVLILALQTADTLLGGQLAQSLGLDPSLIRTEPWRLLTWPLSQPGWLAAIGNAVGLTVGLSMASRCSGRLVAWGGLLGATLLAGLWSWYDLEAGELLSGASAAMYAALGMGLVAWLRVRHELPYATRSDWLAGFGTIGVVLLALAVPRLMEAPAQWIHAIGFTGGAALVALTPRTW